MKLARFSSDWLLLIAIGVGIVVGPEDAIAQCPLGIDVSSHQGSGNNPPTTINWANVKSAGISFAWARAAEGTPTDGYIGQDRDFTANEANAKAAGVLIGAYYYAQPDVDVGTAGADTEAAFFWSVAGPYITGGGTYLMPMLDLEANVTAVNPPYTQATLSAWVNEWCQDIVNYAAAAGVVVKPVVYTFISYANGTSGDGPGLDSTIIQWPLNMANTGTGQNQQTGAPLATSPWSTWTFWQYDQQASVLGVSGNCDVDVFNGTATTLLNYVISDAAPITQRAGFFRISGPAATTITALNSDGTMVWSCAQPGGTYTVQTLSSLAGGVNWVNYVQIPATASVNTSKLIDFNPPSGMALVPAGSFTMGDTLDGESDAIPTTIYVSAFYMDVNLVNYSQWQSVFNWATANGYGFDYAGSGKAANHPVQTVDWYDVVKWSNARSQQAGLTPVYYTDAGLMQVYKTGEMAPYVNWGASGYRLPTEAEWEKAARGGLSGQRFPWGDTISESQANYYGYPASSGAYSYDLGPYGYNAAFDSGAYPYTSPVGYFAPNGYGLYDMAGNVFEWCWDLYGTPYGQPSTTNPTGPASGGLRVLRGGDWNFFAYVARCAVRYYGYPNVVDYVSFGFRCVRGL